MGSMNVGKVSFGNTPVAGTTPGAAQQAPVKKADKGDVVVIGGKEIKKSTLAKGGIIATAAAALGTLALAAKRGKVVNPEGAKLIENVKEGFKTFVGKGKEAYKAAAEKAKAAADGAKDKAGEAAADKGKEAVQDVADTAANKGAAEVDKGAAEVDKAAANAPQAAPAAEAPAAQKVEVKPTTDLEKARKEAVNKEIQARADLQKAKNSGTSEEIAAAEAKLQEAKNEAALAKHNLKEAQKANGQARIQTQKEAQLQKTIQAAKDELASAEKELADLNKVKAELEEKGKSIKTSNQRKKHNKAVKQNDTAIAAAEAKVKQAKANLVAADPKRTELAGLEAKIEKQQSLKDRAKKAGKTDLVNTIQKGIDKLKTEIEALKAQIQ